MGRVIIDGVDVSGCNMKCDNGDCALYYTELNNDNNELIYGFNCSDNQDCYYKQLQRIKAEINDIINSRCDNCKYNKDGITCSIGDCGEGKLKIIEDKINEVIGG